MSGAGRTRSLTKGAIQAMQSIACHLCGTAVWVEKYSEQHTSVQWPAGAQQRCTRLAEQPLEDDVPVNRSCPALTRTIEMAVEAGEVPLTRRIEPVRARLG